MRKATAVITFLLASFLVVPSSLAGGFYVGGSLGETSADLSLSDIDDGSTISGDVQDSDTRWKVFGGYNFLKFFAAEMSWVDLGEASIDAVSDGSGGIWDPGTVTTVGDADGFSVEAMGILPIGDKFEVFAEYGYYLWDASQAFSNTAIGDQSISDDGQDPTFGLGFGWNFPGPGQLRVEAERYQIDTMDIDMYSVGVSFGF
jgi:OOP family OmpA-OmpF porin